MQHKETDKVPQRLVQERRVNRVRTVNAHTPRQRGCTAMCLTVDKVAPSSDALTDQQTECRQIAQAGK